jgi:uncharacterized protein with HEPN domain
MKPSASGADRQHLGNLIGHAQAAIGYARAHGRGWWRSAETLDAVLMRISQVGEAASKTSPEVLAEVQPWRRCDAYACSVSSRMYRAKSGSVNS